MTLRTIPFGRPIIGDEERSAVQDVLSGTLLTHGPHVKAFESAFADFTGAPHAIATASCTASLHLAYYFLNLGPGDEVIVPAQTHVATAHSVEYCGAKPIFVDAEPRTGNIDIDQIEANLTDRTRAISVVHYLGLPVDMTRILKIARKYDLFVVEDAALALGTYFQGTHAGLHGDVGCFSFYPVKHITTAEGGMLITNRQDVAETVSKQRAFGIDRNVVSERKTPGEYDVELLGLNYRMNELGAALGVEQMRRLPEFLARRRDNYQSLTAGLREIDEIELLESSQGDYESSYYCHSMILTEPLNQRRPDIMERLKQRGVGTSIYYPHPIPHMSYYRSKYGDAGENFPVATRLSKNSIALPVGPHVDEDDVTYIIAEIKAAIAAVR